jgi:hypothetical protein
MTTRITHRIINEMCMNDYKTGEGADFVGYRLGNDKGQPIGLAFRGFDRRNAFLFVVAVTASRDLRALRISWTRLERYLS